MNGRIDRGWLARPRKSLIYFHYQSDLHPPNFFHNIPSLYSDRLKMAAELDAKEAPKVKIPALCPLLLAGLHPASHCSC